MSELMYKSTRGGCASVTASQAILKGLAGDGGLYVPEKIPKLSGSMMSYVGQDYKEVAFRVMKQFLTDFSDEELRDCIAKAYDGKFDSDEIAPLVKVGEEYFLELFHGPTLAFKDMALSVMPHLMTVALNKNKVDKDIVILTATSGDTGKAALAGFADVPKTRIIVFYPKDGVSKIQELQMVTQKGENTTVVGITGNFDDAQAGVKKIFADEELREIMDEAGLAFSSANSINIGRLVPQVVYYVYSYAKLVEKNVIKDGDYIHVTVPTGNFGNILAAYYAKCMGVPIGRLFCASNENSVLFDFFITGIYDRNRPLLRTSSPSMDILVSSNLERMLYHISDDNPDICSYIMEKLDKDGMYVITEKMKKGLCDDIEGGYCLEPETYDQIREVYEKTGYIIDPHTAVASAVYEKCKEEDNYKNASIIVSTASPYKFMTTVLDAIGKLPDTDDEFEKAEALSRISGVKIPRALEELKTAEVVHKRVCDPGKMKEEVCDILKIRLLQQG